MSVIEKGFGSRQFWILVCSRDTSPPCLNVDTEGLRGIFQKWQLQGKGVGDSVSRHWGDWPADGEQS